MVNDPSHLLPHILLAHRLFQGFPEVRTTPLFHRFHPEHPHAAIRHDTGEVLVAMAELVLERVAIGLGLQRLEGFVFDPPPRAGGFHHGHHPFCGKWEVGDPTPVDGCAIRPALGIPENRDRKVEMGIVQGNIVVPSEPMGDNPFRGPFGMGVGMGVRMAVNPLEHARVVPRLDPDDRTQVKVLQMLDVGAIGSQGILHDNRLEVGMFLFVGGEKPLGGIAFTIVLGATVLCSDHLGSEGDNNVIVWMDKSTPPPSSGGSSGWYHPGDALHNRRNNGPFWNGNIPYHQATTGSIPRAP